MLEKKIVFFNIQGFEEEGGYRLSPSSTVLAWMLVVRVGSEVVVCSACLLTTTSMLAALFWGGSAVSDVIYSRLKPVIIMTFSP